MPETTLVLDEDLIGEEPEAEVVAWLVADGAHAGQDDDLVELSTAKAIVVATAPATGRLTHLVAAGAVVPNGAALCTLAS